MTQNYSVCFSFFGVSFFGYFCVCLFGTEES